MALALGVFDAEAQSFFLDLRCFELPEGFKAQVNSGAFFKLLRPAMPRRRRFAFLPAVLNHMNKIAGPSQRNQKSLLAAKCRTHNKLQVCLA